MLSLGRLAFADIAWVVGGGRTERACFLGAARSLCCPLWFAGLVYCPWDAGRVGRNWLCARRMRAFLDLSGRRSHLLRFFPAPGSFVLIGGCRAYMHPCSPPPCIIVRRPPPPPPSQYHHHPDH